MTCCEMLRVIDAYLDGELSTFEIVRVRDHLLNCERCRTMLESEATLHSFLSSDATEDGSPSELRSLVLDRIGVSAQSSLESLRGRAPWIRVMPLVIGLIAVLLASIFGIRSLRSEDLPPFALEIAAKHRMFTDISSGSIQMMTSDVIGLTEWLERHVGFPVRAPEPVSPKERLIGGRVSSVAEGPAAYVLYEWHGRGVSLFVTAFQSGSRREGAERIVGGVELYTATLSGVTLAWWKDSGRLYTAVSDGPITHLEEFAVLCVRGRPLTRPSARIRGARFG